MSRRVLIAGNWKMNLNRAESLELLQALVAGASFFSKNVDGLVCPAFPYLELAQQQVKGSKIRVGAQDIAIMGQGAYTGMVAGSMLKDFVDFVIVGHSERREYALENDEQINQKIQWALNNQLIPILCIGESAVQRNAGNYAIFLQRQLEQALANVSLANGDQLVVAYEPIWAIGSGQAADPIDTQQVMSGLREYLSVRFDPEIAQDIRLLYGGSTQPSNIESFLEQPDIDGALVGGASLKAESFLEMMRLSNSSSQ